MNINNRTFISISLYLISIACLITFWVISTPEYLEDVNGKAHGGRLGGQLIFLAMFNLGRILLLMTGLSIPLTLLYYKFLKKKNILIKFPSNSGNRSLNVVEKKFQARAIKRGGTSFYTHFDSIDFIKECRSANIIILGIDGFFLTDKTTQPSQENSIDYSSVNGVKDVYEHAILFIEEKSDSLHFEIVCG